MSSEEPSESYIDRISNGIDIAAENGLFTNKTAEFSNLITNLSIARNHFQANDITKTRFYLSTVVNQFSYVMNSMPLRWRFLHLYAGDIWIYLIGFLSMAFFIYFSNIDLILVSNLDIPPTGAVAALFGIVGGVTRGLWKLWTRVNKMYFRKVWRIYFLSCPFLGGIFGSIMYLLIIGGLLAISDASEINSINEELVVIGFAIVAGYNWEWSVKRLEKIGEMI